MSNLHCFSTIGLSLCFHPVDTTSAFETTVILPGDFTGMERVVLTANGNLQRILSAFHAAPITVEVRKCQQVDRCTFDREVDLMLRDKVGRCLRCCLIALL